MMHHVTSKLRHDTDPVFEELLEEITARIGAGELVDVETCVAAHPEYAEKLLRLLPAMQMLVAFGDSQAVGSEEVATPMSAVTGVLGDFRILRELGRGGMGVVFEVEQISLGRRMALKVLPFAAMLDRQQLKRFKNEARAAATLDHPHIVAVHSVGEERGVHYYAMQLVDGQSLAELITQLHAARGISGEKPRSPPGHAAAFSWRRRSTSQQVAGSNLDLAGESAKSVASETTETLRDLQAGRSTVPTFDTRDYFRMIARLMLQAARALDHAHQNGIVHRDVKPANLLLDAEGKLWVTDFGLARIESDAGITLTGDLLGTLAYMSPEQALAKRVVIDHRTDIYSLGVTLYELLTLRRPYVGADRQELLRKIAFDQPRRPRAYLRHIPLDLETIACKAIEKSPDDRYLTAGELADDLERFLSDKAIKASPPTPSQRLTRWSRRNHRLVAAAAAVMALLLVAAATSTAIVWQERDRTQAALNEVRQQKTLAEQSASESKALVKFFVEDLLGAVDPEKARGEKVTVEEIVAEAERKIDLELKDQPLVEAAVRQALAEIQLGLGNAKQAELHLLRARVIQQRLLGSDPATLKTMHLLVMAIGGQNRLTEARQLSERTLELKRRILGPDHPDTFQEMSNLSSVLFRQGSFDLAQKLDEETLARTRRVLGTDAEGTLTAQMCLATTLIVRGRPDRGRQLLQETADAARRIWGDEHPHTLNYKEKLADALASQFDDGHQARRIYQEVLAARRRIYGPIHPQTIQTLNGLVGVLVDRGDYDQAAELDRDLFEQLRADLGPAHPRTLNASRQRASILTRQGHPDPAQTLLEEALEIRTRALGPEHLDTLDALQALADFFEDQERFDQALPLQERLVERWRRVAGAENVFTLQEMHDLARVLLQRGDGDKALGLFQETIALMCHVLGSEHPSTLLSMHYEARTLAQLGKSEQAEKLFHNVMNVQRGVLGPDHRATLKTMHELAFLLVNQGKTEEGLKLHEAVCTTFQRTLGSKHPDTLQSMANLASAHHQAGHVDKATDLCRQALELQRAVLGSEDPQTLTTTHNLGGMLNDKKRYHEAEELLRTAVAGRQKILGQEERDTRVSMCYLARALEGLGNHQEAAAILRQVLEDFRRTQGPSHEDTLAVMHNLALNLRETKQYEEPLTLLRALIEIRSDKQGPEHPDTLLEMHTLANTLKAQGDQEAAWETYAQVATVAYREGQWSRTVSAFENAMEVADTPYRRAVALLYTAMAHWQLQHRETARHAFEQAVEAVSAAPEEDELTRLRNDAMELIEQENEKARVEPN